MFLGEKSSSGKSPLVDALHCIIIIIIIIIIINVFIIVFLGEKSSSGKSPLVDALQKTTESLHSLCAAFTDDIDRTTRRLRDDISTSGADVQSQIDRRADELIASVNEERERKKEEVNNNITKNNDVLAKVFKKHRNLVVKAKEILKMGENLVKSGTESDIKTSISNFKEISAEISTSDPKNIITFLKITLSEKRTETFPVELGEILTQTDRETDRLTDRETDRLTDRETDRLTDRDTDRLTDRETDRLTDRETDRLTLTRTLDTGLRGILSGLPSMAVLRAERSDKIVVCGVSLFNGFVRCYSGQRSALLGEYKLPCPPFDLAKSRDQQVVVALPLIRQIMYLDVQDDIRLVTTLKTEKQYKYISVLPGNRLAVCEWSGKRVDILDEGGRVIQTLNQYSIPRPSRLAVRGECLLIVTDGGNSLTCVTSAGRVTWRSRDLARKDGLEGVACDMEQFVYVCDRNRHRLVQLTRDGQVIRDVITAHDGLSVPLSVCCVGDVLYVCQEGGVVKQFTWSEAEHWNDLHALRVKRESLTRQN